MSVVIYSKPNCNYCMKAKSLLSSKKMTYNEVVIGRDITTEEFKTLYPEVSTVPYIILDGVNIGGYDRLTEHFNTGGKSFLTENIS